MKTLKWLLLGSMLTHAGWTLAQTSEDMNRTECAPHEVLARLGKLSHETDSHNYFYTVLESRNSYFVDSGVFSEQEAYQPQYRRFLQAKFSDVFCYARPGDFLEIQGQAR